MQTEKQADLFSHLHFDLPARQYLRSMARSAMIIVVVSMIGYVLSAADLMMESAPEAGLGELSDVGIFLSVATILVGLLINYFLYRFAAGAGKALNNLDQEQLNGSFNYLKIYFVITAIVSVVLLLLILFFSVALGTGLLQL